MSEWMPPARLNQLRFAHALMPRKDAWGCLTAGFAPAVERRRKTGGSSRPDGRYSMHYVISGTSPYQDPRGRAWELAPGDFFEFLPDETHTYPYGTDDFLECVLILDTETARRCRALGLLPLGRPVGHAGLERRLVEQFEDLLLRMEAESPELSRDWPLAQALEWVDSLYQAHRGGGRSPGALVERACRLLADDLRAERPLEEVADELGVDYDTFRKHFAGAMGRPPGQFRLCKRMDRACVMLYAGRPVQEVAGELGYSDPFAFSRQFKKHTGMPPSTFRRRYAPS